MHTLGQRNQLPVFLFSRSILSSSIPVSKWIHSLASLELSWPCCIYASQTKTMSCCSFACLYPPICIPSVHPFIYLLPWLKTLKSILCIVPRNNLALAMTLSTLLPRILYSRKVRFKQERLRAINDIASLRAISTQAVDYTRWLTNDKSCPHLVKNKFIAKRFFCVIGI